MPKCRTVLLAIAAGAAAFSTYGDEPLFELTALSVQGRVVAADFGDFDNDGDADLVIATLEGMPPAETRTLSVFKHNDGGFRAQPDFRVAIPAHSAMYDIARLDSARGEELVLLRPGRVTVMSLADAGATQRDFAIPGASTIAAAEDERGFDRFQLFHRALQPGPRFLIPQIGHLTVMTPAGEIVAQLDVGQRANYYVARRAGLVSVESDVQLFLDVPRLAVGDVNGDDVPDIVTATRHEIRVFNGRRDGTFSARADTAHTLGLVTEADHRRGTGGVVSNATDIDGDGRLDLMITHVEGSFADATTTTRIYRNRDGAWHLDDPDGVFVNDGALSSDLLLDLDTDGRPELVRIKLKFSLLELIEMLLTREVDAWIEVHRWRADGQYEQKPSMRRKISTAIDFDTFRPRGFMPRARVDLNADGRMDFVTSADGRGIEVFPGDDTVAFSKRGVVQKFATGGRIRFADFDRDGLEDFVLFDSQNPDAPVTVGRNAGKLPGTR